MLDTKVWESENCGIETKKKIVRTVVEQIIVNLDDSRKILQFTIRWKKGNHTQFEMEKPCSATAQKTSLEDLEIIRKMGVRYGDDEIARVLNKLGRRTGTGKNWNSKRVRWIRCRYSIRGRKTTKDDPEILTLNQATQFCNVSTTTIKRLFSSGVLRKEQVVPWAPWEIKRSDLESKPICIILDRLRKTGKLVIMGNDSSVQQAFFE